MITQVHAESNQGSLLVMELANIHTGIFLKEIEGLDPVKASIVTASFPTGTGTQYQASKREERDIKIKLGIEPDYISEEPRDVRNRLYQWFMPKTWVDLTFIDENNGAEYIIRGMTETFEAPLFVREPGADIVVRCFESDFVDPILKTINGNTVSNTLNSTFDYDGTVESGFVFQLNVDRAVDELTLYNITPWGLNRQLDFSGSMIAGDILTIDSREGQKAIRLTRSGVSTSLLYGKSPQSAWIDLWPGSNQFRAYAEGAPIPYVITYYNRHGGL